MVQGMRSIPHIGNQLPQGDVEKRKSSEGVIIDTLIIAMPTLGMQQLSIVW